MTVHSRASTVWKGGLADGAGTTALATGAATVAVDWRARSEGSETTTTPEELLAAAHASCYAMALSHALGEAGATPVELTVTAEVDFVPGEGVMESVLAVTGRVGGIDQLRFGEIAEDAKDNCPISKALAGIQVGLESATLL